MVPPEPDGAKTTNDEEDERYISAGIPRYRRDAIQQHLETTTGCTG